MLSPQWCTWVTMHRNLEPHLLSIVVKQYVETILRVRWRFRKLSGRSKIFWFSEKHKFYFMCIYSKDLQIENTVHIHTERAPKSEISFDSYLIHKKFFGQILLHICPVNFWNRNHKITLQYLLLCKLYFEIYLYFSVMFNNTKQ